MGNMFTNMTNQPITMSVSPQGKVEKVEGFDQIAQGMGPMAAMMKEMFSEDALRQMSLFPGANAKHPTSTGDKWEEQHELELPMGMGKVNMKTVYTLGKVEGNTAQLPQVTTTSLSAAPAPEGQTGPGMAFQKMDGKMTGTVRWDMKAGRLEGSTARGETLMEMAVGPSVQKITQSTEMVLQRVGREDMERKAKAEVKPEPAAAPQPPPPNPGA
jgi:hypothetical protein